MENLTTLHKINLTELSWLEQQEIQGGQTTTITYTDAQGYDWDYTYNERDELIGVTVSRTSCIY